MNLSRNAFLTATKYDGEQHEAFTCFSKQAFLGFLRNQDWRNPTLFVVPKVKIGAF